MEIDKAKLDRILERQERPQAWLAKRVGTHRSTFHHYVTGIRRLPPHLYPQLVAVLGTTDFLKESTEERIAA